MSSKETSLAESGSAEYSSQSNASCGCLTSPSQEAEIRVTNTDGYLCHISCNASFDSSPGVIFAILTNPDNTAVFRDVKAMGYRKVLKNDDGLKVIEVEQRGEFKLLFRKHGFSTFLTVTEDCRDPSMLMTSFSLIRSDVLAKFQGTWQLWPLHSHCSNCTKSRVQLEQDVSPIGVPEFMSNMPVIGDLVKGICKRAVQRVLEDVGAITAELNRGTLLRDVLPDACIPGMETNGTRPRVHSHAVANWSDCSESDEEAGPLQHGS